MHCEKGHPRKMGEGDDKSTLTGNEPLSGSNIGGETTFFPLTVLPFLRACPSFVCRPSSGEMCCSVCMGGEGQQSRGLVIESIRVGQRHGCFHLEIIQYCTKRKIRQTFLVWQKLVAHGTIPLHE